MRRGLLPLPLLLLLLLLPAGAAEAGGAPEPSPGAAPRTTLRVLHLTDVHLDPAYAPGAGPDFGRPWGAVFRKLPLIFSFFFRCHF